jgi:hypothetical protein
MWRRNPSGAASAGAPLVNGATLVAVFDARLSTITTSGGAVDSIESLVGGYTAAPPGASGTRPTWNTLSAAFGGSSWTFDGVDDLLKVTGLATGQNLLVYMTLRQISWTEGDYIFSGTGVSTTLYQHTASPNIYLYNGATGNNSSGAAVGSVKRVWAYYKGASSEIKAGSVRTSGVDSGSSTGADFYIGGAAAGSNYSNHESDLIRIYTATAMPDLAELDAWLAVRNGPSVLT